jgi:putative ABC transport system substrate-binding protein
VKRREFITLLTGAAAWPLAARAQQAAKLSTIGYLGLGTLATESQRMAAFVQRLRELGWIEGRTVAIDYHWADGRRELMAEIAAEFVRLKVDVIFAGGTEPALAAKKATALIPIVFPVAADPVGAGMVVSLARPGGNVTGLSVQAVDLAGKRLEILRDVFPRLDRLAIMANVGGPGAALEMHEFQEAARTLRLEVIPLDAPGRLRRAQARSPSRSHRPPTSKTRLPIQPVAKGSRTTIARSARSSISPAHWCRPRCRHCRCRP